MRPWSRKGVELVLRTQFGSYVWDTHAGTLEYYQEGQNRSSWSRSLGSQAFPNLLEGATKAAAYREYNRLLEEL